MREETKIEDIYFPNQDYKENSIFKPVIECLTNYDYDSLESIISTSNWSLEDIDYSLVKDGLLLFNDAIKNEKRISQKDIIYTFTQDFASNFSELGRYFLVLYETYSEENMNFIQYFADLLLCLSLEVSDILVSNLDGYPETSINASDWLSAVTVIEWLEIVHSFYNEVHTHTACFNIRLCQLKLTIAAKGHYPDDVAWAMYNLAEAFEEIGNIDGAIQCYEAIVNDFSFVLEEEKSHENEYLYDKVEASLESLESLK